MDEQVCLHWSLSDFLDKVEDLYEQLQSGDKTEREAVEALHQGLGGDPFKLAGFAKLETARAKDEELAFRAYTLLSRLHAKALYRLGIFVARHLEDPLKHCGVLRRHNAMGFGKDGTEYATSFYPSYILSAMHRPRIERKVVQAVEDLIQWEVAIDEQWGKSVHPEWVKVMKPYF
jgi:hypothetical protein